MFNEVGEGNELGRELKSRGERAREGAEPPEAAQKKDHWIQSNIIFRQFEMMYYLVSNSECMKRII